jgi:hypothetical protein
VHVVTPSTSTSGLASASNSAITSSAPIAVGISQFRAVLGSVSPARPRIRFSTLELVSIRGVRRLEASGSGSIEDRLESQDPFREAPGIARLLSGSPQVAGRAPTRPESCAGVGQTAAIEGPTRL